MKENETKYSIWGKAVELHNALGAGLPELVYERTIEHKLGGWRYRVKPVKGPIVLTSIFCFLLVIGIPIITSAQETYFTQTRAIPLQQNPAHVAADNYATLLLDHRRQQFLEDVSLQSTVITGKYPLIGSGTNERWGGIGMSLLNDRSHDVQLFRRTQLEAAFAYNLTLAPRTYLSAGVQGGYHQQRFSADGVTTGSQYVHNQGFDPTLARGENLSDTRSDYWNLSSGLLLYRTDARQEAMTFLSVAVHRLHQPRESLLTNTHRLAPRYVVAGGQRVFDNRTWTITPHALWVREGTRNLLRAGAEYRYHFKNNNPLDPLQSGNVALGTYYTDARAISLSLQFNQPFFSAGFSYDMGTRREAMQNATELTLAVRKTINRRRPTRVVRDYSVGEVKSFYEKKPVKISYNPAVVPPTNDQQTISERGQHDPNNPSSTTEVAFSLKKTLEFAFNKAALTAEAQEYFDDFVKLMQLNTQLQLRVVGHTDNVGKERENLKVSLARAQAVKDYLVAHGINKGRITVDGVGAAEPLVTNDTAANRAKNRRVELIVSQR